MDRFWPKFVWMLISWRKFFHEIIYDLKIYLLGASQSYSYEDNLPDMEMTCKLVSAAVLFGNVSLSYNFSLIIFWYET